MMANTTAKDHLPALTGSDDMERIVQVAGKPLEELLAQRSDGMPREIIIAGPPRKIFDVAAKPIRLGKTGNGWVLVTRNTTHQRDIEDRVQEQYRLASVGQLAAGIAHDFNNMLTVMMGTAQILEMKPEIPQAMKEDVRVIYTQGQRAAQLIRQILDFSRKTVTQKEPLDLVPWLKEAIKLLKQALPETVDIKICFENEGYVVKASPTQLQQVITNLAVNARDAMPQGGALTISLSHLNIDENHPPPLPEMSPGKWVSWQVSDTGTGIRLDALSHIFEPFFTTKQPDKGTGLGLAQVYGIVKQHGGEIKVESKMNEGAVFTIYLPLSEQPPVENIDTPTTLPPGHGETILVVEDEPGVLKVARSLLESLNYRVLTAADGQEALAVFQAHRETISLVLTDMVMPKMGGKKLIESLHAHAPDLPFVLMSGYTSDVSGSEDFLKTVTDILEKPLVLEQVAEVINKALRHST